MVAVYVQNSGRGYGADVGVAERDVKVGHGGGDKSMHRLACALGAVPMPLRVGCCLAESGTQSSLVLMYTHWWGAEVPSPAEPFWR